MSAGRGVIILTPTYADYLEDRCTHTWIMSSKPDVAVSRDMKLGGGSATKLTLISVLKKYTNLYIMYPDRKSCISAQWTCFQIVNILFRS